jgi:hypothetical protein
MSTPTSQVIDNDFAETSITRYPLQLEIATVFTLLIAVLGLSLVWFNYQESKIITLLAANDMFEQISKLTAANIQKLYTPTEALVDLTAQKTTPSSMILAHNSEGILVASNNDMKVAQSNTAQAEDLSVPERIMAIADIFETLTASDRPYKKASKNQYLRIS